LRKLSIALALGFLVSMFGFIAAPASAQPMHPHHCGRGYHWVMGHRDRYGRWIPGHCRANR
jgi:hypothetical protein